MTIYTTDTGNEIEYSADDDRKFFAVQALLSQRLLEIEDRAEKVGRADEVYRCDCRMIAVDEWSEAVRNGFVCC